MKKTIIKAVIVLWVLLVCLVVFLFAAGRSPEPDVSDLKVERIEVAPEDNAYTHFTAANDAMYEPEDRGLRREARDVINDYLEGEDVDKELLKTVLRKNAEAFHHVREGVQRDVCLVPEVTDYNMSLPYLPPWRHIGRLLAAKSRYSREDGDYAEAVNACTLLLRFGNMISKDAGSTIHYLVGAAVINMGLSEAYGLARDPGMSPDKMAKLSNELNVLGPLESGMVRAHKVEFRLLKDLLERFPDDRSILESVGVSRQWPFFLARIPYFYNRHKTIEIAADFTRNAIKNAPLCHSEADLYDIWEELSLSLYADPLTIFRQNSVGIHLLQWMLYPFGRIIEVKHKHECKIAAIRLILSLNTYRMAEGGYPQSLEALVPEYIDEIPRDPYDCEPFRYSKSRGIVYSVGENLEDMGGSKVIRQEKTRFRHEEIEWNRWDAEDIVFEITTEISSDE